MSQYFQYLVFVGVILQGFGAFYYIRETLRGKTKPNRVTWLMWAVAPLIATVAAISDGVGLSVLPVFMSGFGPLIIFLSTFATKKAYWKLERFDYLCGAMSLLALVLWFITKQPIIAIIFAITSDFFAAIPTLIKSWKHPETETVSPYIAGLISALTAFAAIKRWSFSDYAFPLYLVIVCIFLIFAVYAKRIFHSKPAAAN